MKKVILMLAVAAMASCAKSELTERPAAAGDVELKLTSTVLGIDTRTPFEGSTIDGTHQLEARVLVSKESGKFYKDDTDGSTNFWANGKVTFESASETSFDPKVYYPTDGSDVYVFGLYPYDQNNDQWTINANGQDATFEIDGATDVMTASGDQATNKKSTTAPTLAFAHKLAKYIIQVVTDPSGDSEAIKAAWGDITNIELLYGMGENNSPNKKITVKFADNSVTASGGDTDQTPLNFRMASGTSSSITYTNDEFGVGKTASLSNTETVVAYALVAPITPTSSSDQVYLKVHTKNDKGVTAAETVPVTLKQVGGATDYVNVSTEGKEFTITLTFKASEITPKATVSPWTPGGEGKGELE